jgi:hypothetical protein
MLRHMRRTRFRRLTVKYLQCTAGAVAAVIECPAVSRADSITFHLGSSSPYGIELRFYSKTLSRVWPGNGKVFFSDDHQIHEYSLSCDPGEKICYGVWTTPHHTSQWGVGDDGQQACADCCGTCGSDFSAVNLTLRSPVSLQSPPSAPPMGPPSGGPTYGAPPMGGPTYGAPVGGAGPTYGAPVGGAGPTYSAPMGGATTTPMVSAPPMGAPSNKAAVRPFLR